MALSNSPLPLYISGAKNKKKGKKNNDNMSS